MGEIQDDEDAEGVCGGRYEGNVEELTRVVLDPGE